MPPGRKRPRQPATRFSASFAESRTAPPKRSWRAQRHWASSGTSSTILNLRRSMTAQWRPSFQLHILLNQLTESTLYRAAFSKRQLYERMVAFWSDHFNIYYPKVNYLKPIDDRDVIRKHALGKFPDMLRASAHSPAMLEYLDNTRSR